MAWLSILFFVAMSFIAGGLAYKAVADRYVASGTLRINLSDPHKDTYSIEISEPLSLLHTKELVILEVVVEDDISHEKQTLL